MTLSIKAFRITALRIITLRITPHNDTQNKYKKNK
jgi:hypothetical protein